MLAVHPLPVRPVPPPAATPLVEAGPALHLVAAVLRQPPAPETVCILLAADRTGLGCVSVDEAADPDSAVDVARVAAGSAAGWGLGAVVLATSRPGWGHLPDDCDRVCFGIMRSVLREAGVVLVDWFLVDRGRAASMAQLTGRPARWQP